MADNGASLVEMMTALQNAHNQGDVAGATQIAGMVQRAYPAHTAAMLSATPAPDYRTIGNHPSYPTPPSAPAGSVGPSPSLPLMRPPPSALSPMTAPVAGMTQLPNLQAPMPGEQPPAPQPSPPAGQNALAGSNAPPIAGADTGGVLGGLGQELMGVARSWVGALPGNNIIPATLRAAGDTAINALGGSAPQVPGGFSGRVAAYQQAMGQANAADAQQTPLANFLGSVAGNTATVMAAGGALGAGAKALGASGLPIAAPIARAVDAAATWAGAPGGGIVSKAARLATAGAAGGAASAVADAASKSQLPNMSDVLVGGAAGAAAGPVAGVFSHYVGQAADKSWTWLAAKINGAAASGALDKYADADAARYIRSLNVTPDSLASTMSQATAVNGGNAPTLAQVLPAIVQGEVKKMAGQAPALGNTLATAADAQRAATTASVPDLVGNMVGTTQHAASPTGVAGVQSLGDVQNAVDTKMDAAMAPIRAANTTVPVDSSDIDALTHPVIASLARNLPADARNGFNQAIADASGGGAGQIPVDTLDLLRRSAGRVANSSDAITAASATPAREGITAIAQRDPAYASALDMTTQHRAYAEGFQNGLSGNAIKDIDGAARKAADPDTGDAFTQGHASGFLSGMAQQAASGEAGANSVLKTVIADRNARGVLSSAYGQPALDDATAAARNTVQQLRVGSTIAPGSPVGPNTAHGPAEGLAHAAVGAALESHWGIWKGITNAVKSIGGPKLNDAAAGRVAEWFTSADPQVQQQAIATMRRVGASDDDLGRIRAYIAAAAGAKVSPMTRQQQ